MTGQINHHEAVRRAVHDGAVLFPDFFDTAEVSVLARDVHDHQIVSRRIPRLGSLVRGLVDALNGGGNWLFRDPNPCVGHHLKHIKPTTPGQASYSHSGRGRFGLSLIAPVSETPIDLYVSEHPFVPSQDIDREFAPVIRHELHQGDLVILRQGMDVADPADMTVLQRLYPVSYALVSEAPSAISICDVVVDTVPTHALVD